MADAARLIAPILERPDGIRALDCGPGSDYDEEAFHYLLAVERIRAERSNRPLRLVFATLEPEPGKPARIPPPTAARLLSGLRQSLRETDVVGWYRQHRVAGVVLSERPDGAQSDGVRVIEQRVDEGLRRKLPAKVARTLRVRVVRITTKPSSSG